MRFSNTDSHNEKASSSGFKETVKKHRADIIVIASILVFSLLVLAVMTLTRKDGAAVVVEINGTEVAQYPLDLDNTYTLNGGTNVLTIENGTARMSESSCPDHVCENKGKIKYVGQTIVCLPNKLTVTVRGSSDDGGVDFVS